MKISKFQFSFFIWALFNILVDGLMTYSNIIFNRFIAIQIILFCVINLVKSRNRIVEFMLHIQLLYYNYSVVFSRYVHLVNEYDAFYRNADEEIMGIGILGIYIFEITISLFTKGKKIERKTVDSIPISKKPNYAISTTMLLVSIYNGIFMFDWSKYGLRGATSSYYEYTGIVFILGLYYAGKGKLLRTFYSLTILLFIIQGLVFGERVATLQFIFIWTFFFIYDKLKAWHIILGCATGIMLMVCVGIYRSTYALNGLTLKFVLNQMSKRFLTFDGADLGYYCSLTFVMVAQQVDWNTRARKFFELMLSVLIGDSKSRNLASFTRQYYAHWFGGFYPLHFYFYGGILGEILSSFAVTNFFGRAIESNLVVSRLIGVYLVCICARWYLYTPISAIRPVLIFTIGYIVLNTIDKIFFRGKSYVSQ